MFFGRDYDEHKPSSSREVKMESGRKSVISNFVQQVFVVEDSLDLLRVYAIFQYLGAVCQKRKVSAYDAIRDTERLNSVRCN